jgi:hypothetical protein
MKGRTMDEKTSKYVNNLISMLTKQRNDALDLNVKLQAELALINSELNETKKKEEKEEKEVN